MKTRWIPLLIGLLLVVAAPVVAQSRSFYWQRWDMVITNINTSQNSFDVVEQQEIVFQGEFRFGFRVIPTDRAESLAKIRVLEDGRVLTEDCSGAQTRGTFCARDTDEGKRIDYYFHAPIRNRSVNVSIFYTVQGGLRSYEGGDQLNWFATATEHSAPIRESVVVVNLPGDAIPREGVDPVVTYGVPAEVDVCREFAPCAGVDVRDYLSGMDSAVAVARATEPLGVDEALEFRMQYPHNPAMAVPSWQASFDQQRTLEPLLNLGIVLLGIVLGIGGPLGMYALYYARGRDPHVGPVPEYLAEPPSDLSPALVGTLIDERADLRDVLSTLIDLAHRGYLVFEEDRTDGVIFGIGAETTITLKRTNKDTSKLQHFEREILKRVFGISKFKTLDSLKNKFYQYLPALQKDLYEGLVERGYFARNPNTVRNGWRGLGIFLLFVGAAGFVLMVSDELQVPLASLALLPFVVMINGLVVTVAASFMPAKSYEGALEAAKWKAFQQYLQNLESYADIGSAASKFDSYLPYAVAFNLDKVWIRKFTRSQTPVPIPPWYFPTYVGGPYSRGYTAGSAPPTSPFAGDMLGGGDAFSFDTVASDISAGLESISDGLTEMLNSTASVLSSKPSGSSGSWGGGGFSGGGGFGGGGGGGGSAGFG